MAYNLSEHRRPETPSGERQQIGRIVQRARMMNLLHEALLSAHTYRDLYKILVAGVVWPTSMGFSRTFLFRFDTATNQFRGCGAFGVADRQTHDQLRVNILSEQDVFQKTIFDPSGAPHSGHGEQSLFEGLATENSSEDAFWVRLARQFDEENISLRQAREISFEAPLQLPRVRNGNAGASDGRVSFSDFLAEVLDSRGGVQLSAEQFREFHPPEPLSEIITADTIWCPVRTRQGPRLLMIADKVYDDQPIDDIDQLQIEWFCSQAALALEKIELLSELRHTNESLKVLDTLKSNFLSTISHELRSPLTSITGFTRLLYTDQVGRVTDEQKDVLRRVLMNAEKLTHIINDLIEIVEIDSGIAHNLNLGPVNPIEVLRETLPKLEPRRQSKGTRVELPSDEGVPFIHADPNRLARIFYHLLDNALKFSPRDSVVRIEFFVPGGLTGRELQIRIIDQGIGIPPEKLDRIFGAFYQIDNQLARVYEGMGIGLTLTNKLISGTGGRLMVHSAPGEGSTFTMVYPLA